MRLLCLFAICRETVIIFLTCDCEYVFIFCCVFQSASVEEAVSQLLAKKDGKQKLAPLQPLLFRCQDQYFVLGDKVAIPVINAGCFTEAVEFLFFCFFVFNVQYPPQLRYFYCFLEHILCVPPSLPNSVIISDFFRKLAPYLSAVENGE